MNYKADALRKKLGRTDGPVVVDVRSKREYLQARISGAIHLPFWQTPFRYKLLDAHRDKGVVLYCEHGPRAVFARQILQAKGFKAECLEGHMQNWRRCGYPLERN